MVYLFRFFRHWPLWALHLIGALLGWLAFLFSVGYRRSLLQHARMAGIPRSDVWSSIAAAGRMVAELPRLWLGKAVSVHMRGAQHIDAAHSDGRGILFLTPHLGCFEITASAYAARYGVLPGKGITVLYRPARKPWLRELVGSARQRPGLVTAPTSLAGVKQLVKALRNGGAVGLLPDQVPPAGQGVWAPFFGKPAYTMTLGVKLARTSNTVVLLAWGERLSWGRGYIVHVQPLSRELSDDVESACQEINQAMEGLIASRPSQYLWGYNRYKQPKEGET